MDTGRQIAIGMRARAPGAARWLFRVFRSFTRPPVSAQLAAALVRDCRFCASRLDMLDHLPHGAIVAELGTDRGDFAREIVTRTRPAALHLIDLSYANFDDRGLLDAAVRRHQGDTRDVISDFPSDHFDWIYVDADHSYRGALRDAHACAPKVKPGGFLVFNDFAHIDPFLGRYGVHRAVVDFANETGWPFRFLAYQVAGLYDVALQKPV